MDKDQKTLIDYEIFDGTVLVAELKDENEVD